LKETLSRLWPWRARARTLKEEMKLTEPIDAQLVTQTMLLEFLRERRSDRRWAQFKRLLFALILLTGIGLSVFSALRMGNLIPPSGERNYRVGIVGIRGVIGMGTGSADAVIPALRRAFEDRRTEVVVLRIDSPGGSPSEAERIYSEVGRLKEKHKKPVESVIDNLGASAAYLIAIHTDRITAGHYSLVGSVGAVMHSWNAADLAQKVGIVQQAYASGSLKDMGNPTRVPTAEEQAKALALVSGIADIFAKEVVAARGERLKITMPALTTGEAWSGAESKAHGLVDELGTLETVLARLDSRGRFFGPHQSPAFGDAFGQWASGLGASLADGMIERLRAQTHSSPWRAE
jgi:protease-4